MIDSDVIFVDSIDEVLFRLYLLLLLRLAMLYRMINDFTWHVSTGPEKENLIFFLFSATPGRDTGSLSVSYLYQKSC